MADEKIVDSDSRWPILYGEENRRIIGILGDKVLPIKHIGSSAVPGLGRRPVIDILVIVDSLADAKSSIGPLRTIGWEYREK